ncbi:MAG: hypothetical protein IMY86_06010, partial [Chloroflexi bacterium]|nr:hypothetical protein [Chloroflexota bacterium]
MKRVLKHPIAVMLILVVPLGLAFLLTSALPAIAEPVDVTPLPPVTGTDGRAGASWCFYYDPAPDRPFIQMALDAGSRWDRFDFAWPRLEPSNGNWDGGVLQGYDDLVSDLRDGGMNIVGILLWTPDWAATGGLGGLSLPRFDQRPPGWYAPTFRNSLAPQAISASSSPPRGLYEEWDDWTTDDGDPINYWGRFVYQVVDRYGDRVKHWEMWNEPEWDYFWTG